MKRYSFYTILLLSLFFLSFCGKKGPIYPPVIKIPKTAESLKVIQRGDKIMLTWINPTAFLDGSPMTEIKEVQLWIIEEALVEGVTLPSMTKLVFSEKARILKSIPGEKLKDYLIVKGEEAIEYNYIYTFNLEDIGKKRFTFAVKIIDKRKKYSDLSDFISLEPKTAPLPPPDLTAEVFQDIIKLEWKPSMKNIDQSIASDLIICFFSYNSNLSIFTTSLPGSNVKGYNIYRLTEANKTEKINSTIIKNIYFYDRNFAFGTKYQYFVRASATESYPFLESKNSASIKVTPLDRFPPDPPKGLSALAGESFITLIWDTNQEKDLAGYKVWRKKQGETQYKLITPEAVKSNSFLDSQAKNNILYEYAVTACDTSGNESEKSSPQAVIITGGKNEDLPL